MKIEQSLILIDGTSRIEAPKTERSRRIVDLDVATLEALRAHKKRQLEERLTAGAAWTNSDLVFTDG